MKTDQLPRQARDKRKELEKKGPYSLSETPGEDPYLTGEYAIYYTKGMQIAVEDPYHIQASACCKHYVANSMEGTTQRDGEKHDRQHVDSIVPMQDLIDSYMKPFQACVEQGDVTGLMCA